MDNIQDSGGYDTDEKITNIMKMVNGVKLFLKTSAIARAGIVNFNTLYLYFCMSELKVQGIIISSLSL